MNMKLRLAVVATLLLTGCQTLPTRNDAVTDDQLTAQTASKAHSALDRSEEQQPRISIWRHASNEMKMEIPNRAEVIGYRDWYLKHPKYLNTVTQRAAPYLYLVAKEIEKRDMPMELVLLPVVESAYNPNARSPSNAVGLWQFTSGTGQRYGLKQDYWYDGRRDIQASTHAALDYLQKLHDDFNGDWFHAIAAYNAGEGRIQKAVDRSLRAGKSGDFWSLDLPRQTTEYVPRLLALADIIKNADRYGVKLPSHPNKQQWQQIDAGGQVSLSVVAEMAGLSLQEVKALNPGYLRGSTPSRGPHHLLVPKKDARELELALAELPSGRRLKPGEQFVLPGEEERVQLAAQRRSKGNGQRATQLTAYTVKSGDSLWSIGKAHGVTKAQLLSWNKLPHHQLKVGQTIKLQAKHAQQKPHKNYEVRRGDSLYSIAQRFQVSIDELKRLNRLSNSSQLKPGQTLIIKG